MSRRNRNKHRISLQEKRAVQDNDTILPVEAPVAETLPENMEPTVVEQQFAFDENSTTQPETDVNQPVIQYEEYAPKPSKTSAVIAIVAGILIIAGGIGLNWYLTQRESQKGKLTEQSAQTDIKIEKETSKPTFQEGEFSGIVPAPIMGAPKENTSGVITPTTLPKQEETPQKETPKISVTQQMPEIGTTAESIVTGWKANDYKQGDITGTSYTVRHGDTLWEIAEAVYGNGSQWHKIADANHVSSLANGNPLIISGQVLVIPT